MYIKFLTFVLNDLFTETSKGCRRDVNPSGITAILVFFSPKRLLTESTICAENESKTNNDCGLENLSRLAQTFSIQLSISFSFIHPVWFARIITSGGKFPRGIFLSLKIIIGESFVPSAIQVRTTVKLVFSCPVVRMLTDRAPNSSIVVLLGRSKDTGVSSILPINAKG